MDKTVSLSRKVMQHENTYKLVIEFKVIIYYLEEIRAFGVLQNWINRLIQEYQLLDEAIGDGDFYAIFKQNKNVMSFKPSLDKIRSL